jgi:hypothetical protein
VSGSKVKNPEGVDEVERGDEPKEMFFLKSKAGRLYVTW